MLVTRKSVFSGTIRSRELNITEEQIDLHKRGMLIQHCMPNLTASEREFYQTGVTDEEWDEAFSED